MYVETEQNPECIAQLLRLTKSQKAALAERYSGHYHVITSCGIDRSGCAEIQYRHKSSPCVGIIEVSRRGKVYRWLYGNPGYLVEMERSR